MLLQNDCLPERHARYPFANGWVAEKRVLDFGCGCAATTRLLAEAGSTHVVVAEGGTEGAFPSLPLPYEDDEFDAVICHDLSQRLAHSPRWALELRRVLHPGGWLLCAVAGERGGDAPEQAAVSNPDPQGASAYATVCRALASHFGQLQVFGQSAIRASLFFAFDEQDAEASLAFDRSLLAHGEEHPDWYLLLFGPAAEPPRATADLQIVQSLLHDRASAEAHAETSASDATWRSRVEHLEALARSQEQSVRAQMACAKTLRDRCDTLRAECDRALADARQPAIEAKDRLASCLAALTQAREQHHTLAARLRQERDSRRALAESAAEERLRADCLAQQLARLQATLPRDEDAPSQPPPAGGATARMTHAPARAGGSQTAHNVAKSLTGIARSPAAPAARSRNGHGHLGD